jgi:small-conductance mechanosensitive channel
MASASHPLRTLEWAILALVLIFVLGFVAYDVVATYHLLPLSLHEVFLILLTIVLGAVVIRILDRAVARAGNRWQNPRRTSLVRSVVSFAAYILLAVVVIGEVGVGGVELLAAGGFLGIILGLASQTALANLVAGVVLLFARPMAPQDRVTVTTWQYGLLAPTYPPKFYSQDFLIPGFTGQVVSLGIMYSDLRLDDGTLIKIPNNILIQAAVVVHPIEGRWVRVKYEVPPTVDPALLLPRVQEALAHDPWILEPERIQIYVNQATQAGYVISVDAHCRGTLEDPPRSSILMTLMAVVRAAPRSSGT